MKKFTQLLQQHFVFLAFLLSILVLLVPAVVLAQVDPALPVNPVATPTWLSHIADLVLSPAGLEFAIGGVLAIVGLIVGTNEVRRRRVSNVIHLAFLAAEDEANNDGADNTAFDKTAAALKAADEWMVSHGWRKLQPNEQDTARLGFKALNAQKAIAEGPELTLGTPVPGGVLPDAKPTAPSSP